MGRLDELQELLDLAVNGEDYERAADIRDQMRQLEFQQIASRLEADEVKLHAGYQQPELYNKDPWLLYEGMFADAIKKQLIRIEGRYPDQREFVEHGFIVSDSRSMTKVLMWKGVSVVTMKLEGASVRIYV